MDERVLYNNRRKRTLVDEGPTALGIVLLRIRIRKGRTAVIAVTSSIRVWSPVSKSTAFLMGQR
jgi:hypothetical protein